MESPYGWQTVPPKATKECLAAAPPSRSCSPVPKKNPSPSFRGLLGHCGMDMRSPLSLLCLLTALALSACSTPKLDVRNNQFASEMAPRYGVRDYAGVQAAALAGRDEAIRQMQRLTPNFYAEAAVQHQATLMAILERVGDTKFAANLQQESPAVRSAVGTALRNQMAALKPGISPQAVNDVFQQMFPQTYAIAK